MGRYQTASIAQVSSLSYYLSSAAAGQPAGCASGVADLNKYPRLPAPTSSFIIHSPCASLKNPSALKCDAVLLSSRLPLFLPHSFARSEYRYHHLYIIRVEDRFDKMPSYTTAVRTFKMSKSLNESLASAETNQSRPTSDQRRAAKNRSDSVASDQSHHRQGITFAGQDKLPKLPIPDLESTTSKYLAALKPLQSPREHAETKQAVEEFLRSEGPELQERLKKYANGKTSYIEQFCKWCPTCKI